MTGTNVQPARAPPPRKAVALVDFDQGPAVAGAPESAQREVRLVRWPVRSALSALVLVALLLTHITIVAVTVFLDRHQAHRAVDLHSAEKLLRAHERARLAELLPKSPFLQTMVAMRHELVGLWARSMATREQLVGQLQDSCRRAETSEIKPLAEFSRQLRCYA